MDAASPASASNPAIRARNGASVVSSADLSLDITLTDRGEPGSNDSIGITLYGGNTLLFASDWNGAKTVEGGLDGGNLVVH